MFHWLRAARNLSRLGVLGMNQRNIDFLHQSNPRPLYPLVDDKLAMDAMCRRLRIPTPESLGVISSHGELHQVEELLPESGDCVLKPARGSAGRGILVLIGREEEGYLRAGGRLISGEELRQHLSDLLSGMHSLGGRPDRVIVQRRIGTHSAFARISPSGLPDIRVVLYRGKVAMAMLRLPTLQSGGRANLQQGGVGVGIDLESGRTCRAIHRHRLLDRHPDTGEDLLDREIPEWDEVLSIAKHAARAIGLGFVGIDMVVDPIEGPMLLEANARPGLAIQLANGEGLLGRLRQIEEMESVQ